MIGPGWLPGYRPRTVRRRTLPYTRMRRRSRGRVKKQATPAPVVNTELETMLFDQGPAELPTAAVVPREPRARAVALVEDLKRWVAARWQWFRPRTVPCVVAGLGMLAVMVSADYLAHGNHEQASAPRTVQVQIAPP